MIGKQTMQDAVLTFCGGPLDGEKRRRSVRADWTVLRFEEPAADLSLRHVYAGCRVSRSQTEISMRYLGLRPGEEGAA